MCVHIYFIFDSIDAVLLLDKSKKLNTKQHKDQNYVGINRKTSIDDEITY